MLLLVLQSARVALRRLRLHRRIGWAGVVLAAAMVVAGTLAALVAARRPTGFIGVPVPPLEFLAIPLFDLPCFAAFVTLGVLTRRQPQAHKRWMVLATVTLLPAAISRWPYDIAATPLRGFGLTDGFVLALAGWDLASRRRLHPVTAAGGLAFIVSQPLRFAVAGTSAWLAFARWAVGLLG